MVGVGAVDLGCSTSLGYPWEAVPCACVHSCWAHVLVSGRTLPRHHMVPELPCGLKFRSSAPVGFSDGTILGNPEKQKGKPPKAWVQHERFSVGSLNHGAQAPAWVRVGLSLLELLKALVGSCPSQNLPPILLSGCSAIKTGSL